MMTLIRPIRVLILLACAGLFVAGCQPDNPAPREVITPFLTMTPGRVIQAALLPPDLIGAGQLAPATAVAISRQPTPTPDLISCLPLTGDVPMEDTPPVNQLIIAEEIVRYLTTGGKVDFLATTLRDTWKIIGETGNIRTDIDLTGEGSPEIIVAYTVPEGTGALLIAGCSGGVYQALFEAKADTIQPPQLIVLSDLNHDTRNDLLFALPYCEHDDSGAIIDFEKCNYQTQLVTWQPLRNRFVNLLPDTVYSDLPPEVTDFDNDQVTEVVIKQDSTGTRATGPLRTGVWVYDWDGSSYLLSLRELQPARFRVQVIFEADRQFNRRQWVSAIPIYQSALQDGTDLRYWFDDEPEILRSYALYKLVIAQIAASDSGLSVTQEQITKLYPDPTTTPVYIEMAQAFAAEFAASGDVSAACQRVRTITVIKTEALDWLNRYGTRNPRYTDQDLCPF